MLISLLSVVLVSVGLSLTSGQSVNSPGLGYAKLYPTENARQHKTDKYQLIEDEHLIVRRGDPFKIGADFTETWSPDYNPLVLQFRYGNQPSVEDGSLVQLQVLNEKDASPTNRKEWSAQIVSSGQRSVDIEVFVPTSIPVGEWSLRILIRGQSRWRVFGVQKKIFILFNPWAQDDEVYSENEDERQGYVLGDFGKIHMGSYENMEVREWLFGQFKKPVLPAVLYVLSKANVSPKELVSPMGVAALLSAMVNSNDENGVIFGKWDEPYTPFKAPWEWSGSVSILQQYHESGGQPVKYGQCWVFAGVLTTMCRALGIPARVITNYRSAHDSNGDLKIERYVDQRGNILNGYTRDSIWNFHVWTEVWLTRPDLTNQGYGGWQVIDGTPQEPSEGIFRLGPSPVKAVKVGDARAPFDTAFVIGEVNADLQDYVFNAATNSFQPSAQDEYYIGVLVITQKPLASYNQLMSYSTDEVVTDNYKYPEGTAENRKAYNNARRQLGLPTFYGTTRRVLSSDVKVQVISDNATLIGNLFTVALNVTNRSKKVRHVNIHFNVFMTAQNGSTIATVKTTEEDLRLEPLSSHLMTMEVKSEDYVDYISDSHTLKAVGLARLLDTNQTTVSVETLPLTHPTLNITATEDLKKNVTSLTLQFFNYLPIKLTNCKLSIESRDYGPVDIPLTDLASKTVFKFIHIVPKPKLDSDVFIGKLNCKQLVDVFGQLYIERFQ